MNNIYEKKSDIFRCKFNFLFLIDLLLRIINCFTSLLSIVIINLFSIYKRNFFNFLNVNFLFFLFIVFKQIIKASKRIKL